MITDQRRKPWRKVRTSFQRSINANSVLRIIDGSHNANERRPDSSREEKSILPEPSSPMQDPEGITPRDKSSQKSFSFEQTKEDFVGYTKTFEHSLIAVNNREY
jgi:hypothetical protein